MEYRREIDGLRSFAVLPVIFFHAGFKAFSGGFVGVDVFFVISGYLITSIILNELEVGEFSLLNFYERRARRILPALFFVMLVCLPFSWLWLTPKDLESFSQSLVAVSVFSSNVLFWKTSGYFDTSAELKPLLHTWSLAVEEQYYLLFPIFLMFAWKFGKRQLAILLSVVLLASLALAQWGSTEKPEATFYLLPTRGWELLIGSLCALYRSIKPEWQPARYLGEIYGVTGLALIICGIFLFDKQTPFPSLYTLAPTLGTALVVMFATQKTIAGIFLGNRIFVGIGLISYSTYLWHQPLLAFAKHRSLDDPSNVLLGALVIASIGLAFFSWKYVEAPFRNKDEFTRRKLFLLCTSCTAVFVLIGIVGSQSRGLLFRSWQSNDYISLSNYNNYFNGSSEELHWSAGCFNLTQGIDFFKSNNCERDTNKDRIKVFLIGDSHSAYLGQYLKYYIEGKGYDFSQFSTAYCTPLSELDKRSRCRQINGYVFERISKARPDYVILFAHYFKYAGDSYSGEGAGYEKFLENKILQLKKAGVRKVIVVGQIPIWEVSLPNVLFKNFVRDGKQIPGRTKKWIDPRSIEWDFKLRNIEYPEGAHYVSMKDLLCNESGCMTMVGPDLKTDLIVFDDGHLTTSGAKFVTKSILEKYL